MRQPALVGAPTPRPPSTPEPSEPSQTKPFGDGSETRRAPSRSDLPPTAPGGRRRDKGLQWAVRSLAGRPKREQENWQAVRHGRRCPGDPHAPGREKNEAHAAPSNSRRPPPSQTTVPPPPSPRVAGRGPSAPHASPQGRQRGLPGGVARGRTLPPQRPTPGGRVASSSHSSSSWSCACGLSRWLTARPMPRPSPAIRSGSSACRPHAVRSSIATAPSWPVTCRSRRSSCHERPHCPIPPSWARWRPWWVETPKRDQGGHCRLPVQPVRAGPCSRRRADGHGRVPR